MGIWGRFLFSRKFFGQAVFTTWVLLCFSFADGSSACQAVFQPTNELLLTQTDFQTFSERSNRLEKIAKLFENKKENSNSSQERIRLLAENSKFRSWFTRYESLAVRVEQKSGEIPLLVKPVENAQEGLVAKILMIRQAQYTIDMGYYIFEQDNAGKTILEELRQAVRRGVKVRILVDSLGSLNSTRKGNLYLRAFLMDAEKNAGFMKDENGRPTSVKASAEVVIFNPVSGFESLGQNLARMAWNGLASISEILPNLTLDKVPYVNWNPNRRAHDKFIVTDALFPSLTVAMIGGRNIADRYFETDPSIVDPFVDYEVILRNNPQIPQKKLADENLGRILNNYYEQIYFHSANRTLGLGLYRFLLKASLKEMQKSHEKALNVVKEENRWLTNFESLDFSDAYLKENFYSEQGLFLNTIQNLKNENVFRESQKREIRRVSEFGNSLLENLAEVFASSHEIENKTGQAEEVTLVSPYLWLDGRESQFLRMWLLENPKRK